MDFARHLLSFPVVQHLRKRLVRLCTLTLLGVTLPTRAWCQDSLLWITPPPGSDLSALQGAIEQQAGRVLTLAPEGRLLVRIAPQSVQKLRRQNALPAFEELTPPPAGASAQLSPDPKRLGERPPTPPEQEYLKRVVRPVTRIEPNALSLQRARLQGAAQLPSSVDNSLSQYFPPVNSQGSQGSCTAWASCYYFNTYTQAKDENLNAASGNASYICSPAFMYPLTNGGMDEGASTEYSLARLNDIGCCSWAMKPYSTADYLSWPSEGAWVEALQRRTAAYHEIGSHFGCSERELLAIKQRLANGQLAVTSTDVYSNWYTGYPTPANGVQNAVLFANSGAYIGSHALTLVGYDDNRSYFDGTATRKGAFLLANSWGTNWGTSNSAGGNGRGFMWVAYDFFRNTPFCFGYAIYNDDRDNYRPRLYALAGLSHPGRGYVALEAGIGTPDSPIWSSQPAIQYDGGTTVALTDTNRIAIDLTDGLAAVADFSQIELFTRLFVSGTATQNGTLSQMTLYHDLDWNQSYASLASGEPAATVLPGANASMHVPFVGDMLQMGPLAVFGFSGPQGGPFLPSEKSFTLTNTGSTALDWSLEVPAWASLSKSSGLLAAKASETLTLTANAQADSLGAGIHAGQLLLTNTTSGVRQQRALALEARPASSLLFAPVASPKYAREPLPVALSAVDCQGMNAEAFNGAATLQAIAGSSRSVGDGTQASTLPMDTSYEDVRTQVIYLAGEIRGAASIASLALDVVTVPGQPLENWTIRMKHTSLTSYPQSIDWDNEGWTTVHEGRETVTSTGWKTFYFPAPFYYNGSDNLMIDFSNNGCTQGNAGKCNCTVAAQNRSLHYRSPGYYGDPIAWRAPYPEPIATKNVPNLRLFMGRQVSVTPCTTGSFTKGAWSGNVTLPEAFSELTLFATIEGGGAASNAIELLPPRAASEGEWVLYR